MRHIALLSLLVLLPACSPLANMTPPEVQLVNIRPGTITVFQSQGEVILSILNPNPDPITITGATYELVIDGAHIGRALSNQTVEIPAFAGSEQHATLYISNLSMLTRLRTILEQQEFTYAIRASLHVTTPQGSGKLSTQSAGELNAKPE